eukprot:4310307-Pyramimonas_sp.AAC.2
MIKRDTLTRILHKSELEHISFKIPPSGCQIKWWHRRLHHTCAEYRIRVDQVTKTERAIVRVKTRQRGEAVGCAHARRQNPMPLNNVCK